MFSNINIVNIVYETFTIISPFKFTCALLHWIYGPCNFIICHQFKFIDMRTSLEKWKEDHPFCHDLTNGKGEMRNYYCPITHDHYYNGVAWSKALWEVFINSNC